MKKLVEGGEYITSQGQRVGPLRQSANPQCFYIEPPQGEAISAMWFEDGTNILDPMNSIIGDAADYVDTGDDLDDLDSPLVTMSLLRQGRYGAVTLTKEGVSMCLSSDPKVILDAADTLREIAVAVEAGARVIVEDRVNEDMLHHAEVSAGPH